MHAVWSNETTRGAIADEQRRARELALALALAGARLELLAALRRRAAEVL